MSRRPRVSCFLIALTAALAFGACGESAENGPGGHPVLGEHTEAPVDPAGALTATVPAPLAAKVKAMAKAAAATGDRAVLTIDYPLDESIFPPEFVPPTFLWHDGAGASDTWLVTIEFAEGATGALRILVPGAPPPKGEIDMEAISETNRIYEGTEYQRSAVSWTPGAGLWEEIKRRSKETTATVTFHGFASSDDGNPLSRGAVRIRTSKDPVGAPLFYRDVPLMPSKGEHGRIAPLGEKAIPIIAWRLKDVSQPDSKLVLKGMASCGNCHSFSKDGGTLAMDIDGPDGDKGTYAIKPVAKEMVIDSGDVITWNSFAGKPEGHRTLGFMSRISPDGRTVVTTLNEALFVTNFLDYRFLQAFFPTRGILAFYSRSDEEISALPGADDAEFVHCSPAWSPDGEHLVFSRAKARDPYDAGVPPPTKANDPTEPKIQYDLYRMPFNGGKGGEPVPIEGASANGFSNTFPKVSPDGKWIVWTRCRNGLLMRPDGRLFIVPFEGGEPREMRCNTPLMNSWHSFSPNGRWMVFSSKANRPYTQAFLTHIDEEGNDSPAILVPNCTAANRAVNLPEFLNASFGAIDTIRVPVIRHHIHMLEAQRQFKAGDTPGAVASLRKAIEADPTFIRALVNLSYALILLGQYEQALEHLDIVVKEDPRNLFALWNQHLAFRRADRPVMAKRALDRLISIAPAFPTAGRDLAAVEEELGAIRKALKESEAALSKEPGSVNLTLQTAELNHRLGNLERTVNLLARACSLDPTQMHPAAGLAWLLATNPDDSIRDGARAIVFAEAAVRISEGDVPEVFDILAAALSEAGRKKPAIEVSKRAVALAKEVSSPNLAVIEARLAKHEKGEPIRSLPDR